MSRMLATRCLRHSLTSSSVLAQPHRSLAVTATVNKTRVRKDTQKGTQKMRAVDLASDTLHDTQRAYMKEWSEHYYLQNTSKPKKSEQKIDDWRHFVWYCWW